MLKVYTKRGGNCIAEIKIQPSVRFTSYSADFSIPVGVWPLYYVFEGSGAFDFQGFTIN